MSSSFIFLNFRMRDGSTCPCLLYRAVFFVNKIGMRKCLCDCLLNPMYRRRTALVAKVYLIPLTFTEHRLCCSVQRPGNQYRRRHPIPKWPCEECPIFLTLMLFRVTVPASSHHSNMINSFIMLDCFNYLSWRFVYFICISIARVCCLSQLTAESY